MNLHKSREVIYIAGPFTAETKHEIAVNCNRASDLALRVRALGLVPFAPHTGLAGGYASRELLQQSIATALRRKAEVVIVAIPDLEWEAAMVECRELLQRCDAMLMVEGWERSKGATEERELAKACGIPVFDTFAELVAAGLAIPKREAVHEA